MKVAIIGSNGQLGTDLTIEYTKAGHEVFALTHADIEISSIDSVRTALTALKPDIILNGAAYHNVPVCETNEETAFKINATAVKYIAQVAQDLKAGFLHFSTDYVFDGSKQAPYVETDRCNPLNVYAISKLAGESMALAYCDRASVVRVSGIYGKVPSRAKGGNFVTTMLKLAKEKPEVKVVNDEILSPTCTASIARNTVLLTNTDATGIFHMTAEGETSWYGFARLIWDTLGLTTPLYPTSVKDFASPVKRPFYSVLENTHLNQINCNAMLHWKEDLTNFLKTGLD